MTKIQESGERVVANVERRGVKESFGQALGSDVYHFLRTTTWTRLIAIMLAIYLGANLVFAIGIALCAWIGFDASFWLALMIVLAALVAQPVFTLMPATPPVPVIPVADISPERERVMRLLEQGKITAEESAELLTSLPEGLAALLLRRIEALPPEARWVLEAASVVGEEFVEVSVVPANSRRVLRVRIARQELEINDELSAAITAAEALPPPGIETMFADVYAEMPPHLQEQMKYARALGLGTKFEGAFPL